MKKHLLKSLLALALVLVCGNVWGETVTVTFDATTKTSSLDGVTLSVTDGTLVNGTDYRVYKNQTMTITSTKGKITNIALTYTSANYDGGGWAASYQPNAATWTSPVANGEQARIKNIVVTYEESSAPFISADNVTIEATATSGEIPYTITNPTAGVALNATVNASWITNISITQNKITFTSIENASNEARSADITLSYTGAEDKVVTVTQEAFVLINSISLSKQTLTLTQRSTYQLTTTIAPENATNKSVTWSSDDDTNMITVDNTGKVTVSSDAQSGTSAIITATSNDGSGMSASCEVTITDECATLTIDFEKETTDYTDWIFTNMTSKGTVTIAAHGGTYYGTTGGKASASIESKKPIEAPVKLTCYISKQSTNTATSSWKIEVSSDKKSWTEVKTQSACSMNKGEWEELTADLTDYSNVYVKISYEGSTAIRNIDDLELTYVPAPSHELTILASDYGTISASSDDKVLTNGEKAEEGKTISLSAIPLTGYALAKWNVYKTDDSSTIVEVDDNKFVMPGYAVTISAEYKKTDVYELITDASKLVAGDQLIIVGIDDNSYYAMMHYDGQSNNCKRQAIASPNNNLLYVDADDCFITLGGTENNWTLFDGTYYLYAAGGKNDNHLKGTNGTSHKTAQWTISINKDGKATIKCIDPETTHNTIRHNKSSYLFSCYEETNTNQKDVYIYRSKEIKSHSVNFTDYGYATLFLDYAVAIPSGVNAYYVTVSGETATLHPIENVIPANTGVVLTGEAAAATFTEAVGTYDAIEGNQMVGSTTEQKITGSTDIAYYAVNCHESGEVGFFAPKGAGTPNGSFTMKANKAYLKVTGTNASNGIRIEGATMIESLSADMEEDIYFDLQGRKVENPTAGLYIHNGKKILVK